MTVSSHAIYQRILEAVLARKLHPGMRLGEQALAILFDCSRTLIREALQQLATRGIVTVSSRRGWYVIEPTEDAARQIFDARQIIERGLIRQSSRLTHAQLARLRSHLDKEQAAVRGHDAGLRSFQLSDFHVCLAECLGNRLLASTLRSLAAHTALIVMQCQPQHDAEHSCLDHVRIVDALERGDVAQAELLMGNHLTAIRSALHLQAPKDPAAELRSALQPIQPTPGNAPDRSPKPSCSSSFQLSDDSSYLGALL